MQQDRYTLGRVTVLVQVHRCRRHTGDAHVDRFIQDERQCPPADAQVQVAQDVPLLGGGSDLGHRVDHTVGVTGRGHHGQRGAVVHRLDHRRGVGLEMGVHRDVDHLDPEQPRTLAKGRVRGHRQQHRGSSLPTTCAVPLAGAEHGEHATLGSAAGHRADRVRASPVQVQRPAGEVVLDRRDAGEGGGVQAVAPPGCRGGGQSDFSQFRIPGFEVVTRRLGVVEVERAQGGELGHDLVSGQSVIGQHGHLAGLRAGFR